jgi:SMC interacting uncharacterized protein involved in chromosome segregation
MTAEMNLLLEEGVTRSQELTDAADEALRDVDQMAQAAAELAQRLEEESREACQRMRDLATHLEQAEGAIETARSQAEHGLEAVTTEAGAMKAAAADLLARVRTSLDQVESRTQEVDASIDTEMAGAQQGFQDTAHHVQETGQHAEQELAEAGRALQAVHEAVAAAHTAFADKRETWSAALQQLTSAAHTHADAWTHSLDALLERQAGAIVEVTNGMINLHNQAMEEARQRFVDQAPQELADALQPVEDGFERLGQEAAQRSQDLASEAAQLEQHAWQAFPELGTLQIALDAAAQVR